MTVQELVERDLKKARINLEQAKARANTPLPEVEHLEELCRLRARIIELTKSTDVAREIFEEIEKILDRHSISYLKVGQICGEHYYDGVMQFDIAELRKKYTESEKK
jgi:hypothetical protein